MGYKLKNVTVIRDYARDLPRITAYGSRLNQVWTNLIDNAVDAMEGKGHLTVRTRAQEGWVVVEILDDGPGIPPEIQPRIYEPFFTTKDVGHGTGLGLDIVYRIVTQEHKGRIKLDSEPGNTRFQIDLPTT
jgi:signal transduction histidine kinase